MKSAITTAAALLGMMSFVAAAQSSPTIKDDLFAGTEIFAKGATDINEITMDPDTLGMVGGKDKARARGMVLNVVRTYSYDKPGMYRIEDVNAFRDKLNTGEWHCSVHTRSLKSGESTDVCNRHRSDDLKETAIITVEPKELTFIHTISRNWTGGGSGGGPAVGPGAELFLPGMMTGPEMKANMAVAMAEAHAQTAEMRALHPGMLQTWQIGTPISLGGVHPLTQEQLDGLKQHLKPIQPFDEKQKEQLKKELRELDKEPAAGSARS